MIVAPHELAEPVDGGSKSLPHHLAPGKLFEASEVLLVTFYELVEIIDRHGQLFGHLGPGSALRAKFGGTAKEGEGRQSERGHGSPRGLRDSAPTRRGLTHLYTSEQIVKVGRMN